MEYDPLEIIFNCSILPDPTGGDSPDCYEPVVLQELSEGSKFGLFTCIKWNLANFGSVCFVQSSDMENISYAT